MSDNRHADRQDPLRSERLPTSSPSGGTVTKKPTVKDAAQEAPETSSGADRASRPQKGDG